MDFCKEALIIIIFLLIVTNSYSQPDSINNNYGIKGGINLNAHVADFYKLKGIPNCCPRFELGSGIGFNAGLIYEYKFANHFWLSVRLSVVTLGGELNKQERSDDNRRPQHAGKHEEHHPEMPVRLDLLT